MPPKSEAILRHNIIDRLLTNQYQKYPSMDVLVRVITRELNTRVSSATIQKDISLMKESKEDGGYGAPIKFSRAENGYYYDFKTHPDFTIQSFALSEKEIEAIELATGVLDHFKGIKVNDAFNLAMDKLYASLNIKKAEKNKKMAKVILPEETTYMRGMENFEILLASINKQITISFIHYSYNNRSFKSIAIHPYLLKESNKRWYLIGYSEEHECLRYFGLDRIYDPIQLEKEFIENSHDDLSELFSNKIGVSSLNREDQLFGAHKLENNHEQIEEMVIWVGYKMANYIKSMPLHPSQKIHELGGRGDLLITMNLIPSYELMAMILSYGQHMELKSPEWLRREIYLELNKAIKKYQA